jgi:hypothetical protein
MNNEKLIVKSEKRKMKNENHSKAKIIECG